MKFLPIIISIFILIIWFFYEQNVDVNEKKIEKKELSIEIKKEIEKQKQEKVKTNELINNSWAINNIKKSKINIGYNKGVVEKLGNKSEIYVSIDKLKYSSNIDNIIKINWKNLENIEYIMIWDYSFKTQIIDWFIYILVEENNYLNWSYPIVFQNKDWSIFQYNKKIIFTLSKNNLVVNDITPKILKNDIERNIILQWKWLSKVISIQLSNNIVLKSTSFNVINDNVLIIKIPKNLSIWSYSLNIMNVEWINTPDIKINIRA